MNLMEIVLSVGFLMTQQQKVRQSGPKPCHCSNERGGIFKCRTSGPCLLNILEPRAHAYKISSLIYLSRYTAGSFECCLTFVLCSSLFCGSAYHFGAISFLLSLIWQLSFSFILHIPQQGRLAHSRRSAQNRAIHVPPE